jgi:ribonuclease HI
MNYEQEARWILKDLKTDSKEVKNKTVKILEICDKIKEKGKRYGELKYIEKSGEEAEEVWKEVEKLFDELENIIGEWIALLENEGEKWTAILEVASKIRKKYLIKFTA